MSLHTQEENRLSHVIKPEIVISQSTGFRLLHVPWNSGIEEK